MLAGFRAAAKCYQTLLNKIHAESESDKVHMHAVSGWGDEVEQMYEWANGVPLTRRPQFKAKKYLPNSQEPPQPRATHDGSPIRMLRSWFAAKGTSRPGVYAYKHVAESYNRDSRGQIKMFRLLAPLRAWLKMASPKMYLEKDCNPVPLPEAPNQTQDDLQYED